MVNEVAILRPGSQVAVQMVKGLSIRETAVILGGAAAGKAIEAPRLC